MSLTGSYKIEGGKLIGDKYSFVPRDPNDTTPLIRAPIRLTGLRSAATITSEVKTPTRAAT